MYQYNKRNVLPKDKITGENYDIEIQDRQIDIISIDYKDVLLKL